MGSTLAARRAGSQHANKADSSSINDAPASVAGSVGLTSKSHPVSTRVRPSPDAAPSNTQEAFIDRARASRKRMLESFGMPEEARNANLPPALDAQKSGAKAAYAAIYSDSQTRCAAIKDPSTDVGVIKAWHIHTSMTVNNAVLSGRAKLVIYDLRKDSPTKGKLQEIFFGEDNYCLVQIPPGLANGYKAYGDKLVILANCASEPHRPDEMIRMDPFTSEIPYDWSLKNG